jgi:hypothetical protein
MKTMKKNQLLILMFLLIQLGTLKAQDENYNSFKLNWGMGNLMRQDMSFSDMIYTKWSPVNVQFEYNRSKKLEQQAYVQFGMFKPMIGEPYSYNSFYNGEEEAVPCNFLILDINYSLGKTVLDKGKWKLALGGRSANRLNSSNYGFGPAEPYGYYYSFALDVWVNAKYQLSEKHRFVANLALPIFSYNARSPYLSTDAQYLWDNYSHNGLKAFVNYIKGGKIQSWGGSQSVDFDLSYYYTLSDKWDIGGKYSLALDFNQVPANFTQIENILYLSVNLKF